MVKKYTIFIRNYLVLTKFTLFYVNLPHFLLSSTTMVCFKKNYLAIVGVSIDFDELVISHLFDPFQS